jgi:RNA polymerase sigma factor (sigma-70 family)
MAQALADVTGVETIKTLIACLGVPDFTVDELAQQAGVSRRTVDTVVRRYQHAFDRLPSGKRGGRGRPAVRWRLRADHLDEVVAAVDSHQAALGSGRRSDLTGAPESATVEASLIMAVTALARRSDDAGQRKQLVATARNSLAAAGFGPDGLPSAGQQGQDLAGRARFIAAVADVIDACLSEDQQLIDEAQARAMPHVVDAARYMSATDWMPLAQKVVLAPGTVLSAPVLVEKNSLEYFRELFPTLRSFLLKKDVPAGFVFMTDARAEQSAVSIPVASLVNFQDILETKRKLAETLEQPDCVVVSSSPEVLGPAAEHGAHFILYRGNQATKTEIAKVVNSQAAWGVGLLAGETASRISRDQVEARLRRTLQETGHREEKPAGKAARRDLAGKVARDDPSAAVLVSRAAEGDPDAWNGIVERYAPLIWSICRRYGLDGADVEDVGQKVLLHLVDQLASLRDPAALPGWLATTTRRECLRMVTERGSERLDTKLADLLQPTDATVIDEILTRHAVRTAFAELPARSQQLLSMLISDPPRPFAEISAELGIPVGSIGPQRDRCLAQMRRHPAIAALINTEVGEPGRHSSIEAG